MSATVKQKKAQAVITRTTAPDALVRYILGLLLAVFGLAALASLVSGEGSIAFRLIREIVFGLTGSFPWPLPLLMIWTGGAIKQARKLDMICNQSDFAATLLGQMGISHQDFDFSRDVTSESYRYPFAIHMFNNGISMTDSTGYMLYDLTADRLTVQTSPDAERMARTAKAILQMATEDLRKK